MSDKKNSTALVPRRKPNSLPVPVKKGELKTPFSLVEKAIYLNSKKDVQAILPDVLGRVLARIWIDAEFRDAFKANRRGQGEEGEGEGKTSPRRCGG